MNAFSFINNSENMNCIHSFFTVLINNIRQQITILIEEMLQKYTTLPGF